MPDAEEFAPPLISWTPINKVPVREKSAESSTDFTSETTDSTATLTDDEILKLDPKDIDDEKLLQVATTHTNREIVEKIGSIHGDGGLSDRNLTVRLNRCLTRMATKQQKPRDEVKNEFHELRECNGVFKRGNASMGVLTQAGKAAKKAKMLEAIRQDLSAEDGASEKTEEMEVDPPTPEPVAADESKKALIQECEAILRGDPDLLKDYDTMFKVAGVFSITEIVDRVNAAQGKPVVNATTISERVVRAIKRIAEWDGREREEVKAELEAKRKANGVIQRKNAMASSRRVASKAANKAKRLAETTTTDIDSSNASGDSESDEEDPLQDLEEMGQRVEDGSLGDDDLEHGPHAQQVRRPFGPSPVGYLVGTDAYIPEFRVYE